MYDVVFRTLLHEAQTSFLGVLASKAAIFLISSGLVRAEQSLEGFPMTPMFQSLSSSSFYR